jgi:hypothetical protein
MPIYGKLARKSNPIAFPLYPRPSTAVRIPLVPRSQVPPSLVVNQRLAGDFQREARAVNPVVLLGEYRREMPKTGPDAWPSNLRLSSGAEVVRDEVERQHLAVQRHEETLDKRRFESLWARSRREANERRRKEKKEVEREWRENRAKAKVEQRNEVIVEPR